MQVFTHTSKNNNLISYQYMLAIASFPARNISTGILNATMVASYPVSHSGHSSSRYYFVFYVPVVGFAATAKKPNM
jgi:hypothetical protein